MQLQDHDLGAVMETQWHSSHDWNIAKDVAFLQWQTKQDKAAELLYKQDKAVGFSLCEKATGM